ncbi:hypothetical protein [Paraburkholderia lacunae]|uniref:hypothetical protein n=1 Tax=Paraburkholderia lacunae TaxID=2211104 RepID=UPI001403AD1E|nr:hypothetical protein [Paraburkholderia lacunae]
MYRNQVFDHFQKDKPADLRIAEQAREEQRKQADARIDSGAKKWRFPTTADMGGKRM